MNRLPGPKAFVSWSSGKDSAFALRETQRLGGAEIVGVLTTINEVLRVTLEDEILIDQNAPTVVSVPISAESAEGNGAVAESNGAPVAAIHKSARTSVA